MTHPLPPLPAPGWTLRLSETYGLPGMTERRESSTPYFTADQMHQYLLADRASRDPGEPAGFVHAGDLAQMVRTRTRGCLVFATEVEGYVPLYTHPAASPQEAELTDDEIIAIKKATKPGCPQRPWSDTISFARNLVAALSAKESKT